MNYCTKCGNLLNPEDRFCSSCGQVSVFTEKAVPVLPVNELTCKHCGSKLVADSKFCIACGKAIEESQSTPPKPVVNLPLSQPHNNGMPEAVKQKPDNEKSKKLLKIISAVVTIVLVIIAAFFLLKSNKPTESFSSRTNLFEEEKYDPVKIEKAATTVEAVFATADTAGLSKILSPTSLEQRRQYFSELMPHMPAFAADFKTRKLLYATARFAVYEFLSDEGKFTADFCLGEDGNWKLMRF